MSDLADNAQIIEQMERDAALKNRQSPTDSPQLLIDGQVVCIDCEEPIELKRLKYIVNASRCHHCQTDFENQGTAA